MNITQKINDIPATVSPVSLCPYQSDRAHQLERPPSNEFVTLPWKINHAVAHTYNSKFYPLFSHKGYLPRCHFALLKLLETWRPSLIARRPPG